MILTDSNLKLIYGNSDISLVFYFLLGLSILLGRQLYPSSFCLPSGKISTLKEKNFTKHENDLTL